MTFLQNFLLINTEKIFNTYLLSTLSIVMSLISSDLQRQYVLPIVKGLNTFCLQINQQYCSWITNGSCYKHRHTCSSFKDEEFILQNSNASIFQINLKECTGTESTGLKKYYYLCKDFSYFNELEYIDRAMMSSI